MVEALVCAPGRVSNFSGRIAGAFQEFPVITRVRAEK